MTRPIAWLAVALGPLLAACPNDVGFPQGPDTTDPETGPDGQAPAEDPYWCCDPDQGACVCQGYWRCTEGLTGKTCRQANPAMPDNGGDGPWSCEYRDAQIVCTGTMEDHPDAGTQGGWSCVEDEQTGTVECSRDATDEDFPDGADETWDCSFSSQAEMRACREQDDQAPDDGVWECWTAGDGRTTCVDEQPDRPDDGDWDCVRIDGEDICQGDHFPDDGAGWDCSQAAEQVRCRKGGEAPDDGGGITWDCAWDRDALVCIDAPDGGDDGGVGPGGPDDGGGDGGGPDLPDGGDGGEVPCGCVVGAARLCDEPAFCLFGAQTCVDLGDGVTRWGACAEAAIPDGCEPGGRFAQDFLWEFRGGFWDTPEQRAQDADGDGQLLMAPDWWFNPAGEDCSIRQGRCVQDMWDLDADGDNQESIGDCQGVDECA